jgi:hypothetical protein
MRTVLLILLIVFLGMLLADTASAQWLFHAPPCGTAPPVVGGSSSMSAAVWVARAEDFVASLYFGLLERRPSEAEVDHHVRAMIGGATCQQIRENFLNSEEYKQRQRPPAWRRRKNTRRFTENRILTPVGVSPLRLHSDLRIRSERV